MSRINYPICAEIIDINTDTPVAGDVFFVDTNVWYWLTYGKASQGDRPPGIYQTTDYPNYVSKALTNGAVLYWCGLNLSEIAHLIERTEFEIFRRSNNLGIRFKPKEYRHNYPTERQNVVSEIEAACIQIKSMAKPLLVEIEEKFPANMLTKIRTQPMDGYDIIMANAISKMGVINIITDDGDYSCLPGTRVFTANPNVIQTAQGLSLVVNRSITTQAVATSST